MIRNQTTPQQKQCDWKTWSPKRGDVYLVNLGDSINSEQQGLRPAIILSNNKNNIFSTVVQIAPITSQRKTSLPVHVKLDEREGLKTPSIINIEQTRCVSKRRLLINNSFIKITQVSEQKMREIEFAIKVQFGLK